MKRNVFILLCLFVIVKLFSQQDQTIKSGSYLIRLTGNTESFIVKMETVSMEPGIELITIKLNSKLITYPPTLKIQFEHPASDVQGIWHPSITTDKMGMYGWHREKDLYSSGTFHAPVLSLYNIAGENQVTFAVSEIMNPVKMNAGINERTTNMDCSITLFPIKTKEINQASIKIRIDSRKKKYYEALNDVQKWWMADQMITPAHIPAASIDALYSSWYSFHQDVNAVELEKELNIVATMGFKVLINDDGWQTDLQEGNEYYGDWYPSAAKFPDLKSHVKTCQNMGYKYMMWIALPFVGGKSNAYATYKDKVLYHVPWAKCHVLDPRYPEVREHLIKQCKMLMTDYNLDGLKIDFVDRFNSNDPESISIKPGMDINSIEEAADKLLVDITNMMKTIKPEALIEFRQMYTGPLMRKYGNMLRAHDCAYAAIENKVRVTDIRLISGNTPVHADMLMWNYNESTQAAALQILNIIFAVPQISIKPSLLNKDHAAMTKFLIGFYNEHKKTLVQGNFIPSNPEMNYPVITSFDAEKYITAIYNTSSIATIENKKFIGIINATYNEMLAVECKADLGDREIIIYNCKGEIFKQEKNKITKGLHYFNVPACGIIIIK